jgi:hypothetical protein
MTLSSFVCSRVGLPLPVFVWALYIGGECGAVGCPNPIGELSCMVSAC